MKEKTLQKTTNATIRVRMTEADVHYKGGLVSGAKVMEIFGDAATKILVQNDNTEGLLRAYQGVDFLVPVKSGDLIEVTATLTRVGNTSRDMTFEAYKIAEGKKPALVAKARGTCVVKK